MAEVHPETMIAVEPQVVDCQLGEGSALLNLQSNIYYSLNEVGAFVWNEIGPSVTFAQLCRRTQDVFDAQPEQVHHDLAKLVTRLDEAGLVRCFRT